MSRKPQTLKRQAVIQTTTSSNKQQNTSHHMRRIRSGANQDTIPIRIGDIDSWVEPDSGASANVMDEYQFKALRHRSQEIKELRPSKNTQDTPI